MAGVSFDPVEENASFAKKFDFPYPLLCDTERTMAVAYGAAKGLKDEYPARRSVLIDEEGMVLKTFDAVDPARHPGEVLAELDAAGG